MYNQPRGRGNMPSSKTQRNYHPYDAEFDARSYREMGEQRAPVEEGRYSSGKKHKKSKHKVKRKRSKERSKEQVRPQKSLVDYDDISSESDYQSPTSNSRVTEDRERESQHRVSPATAIKSYLFERDHSDSPVSPHHQSSRKKKRTHSPQFEQTRLYSDRPKAYAEQPKAYAEHPKAYAEHPKAYAESRPHSEAPSTYGKPHKMYNHGYRKQSPTSSPRKRYRSRSASPHRKASPSR